MDPGSPTATARSLTRGLAALLLAGQLGPAPARAQGTLTALEGPAGRAWASVEPGAPGARLTAADAPAPSAAWRAQGPWLEWAALVRAEADARAAGEPADGRRRARLALLAWSQGRSDDAWDHLAHCTAEPAWMAAVAPHLAPGVPLDWLTAPGFDPAAPLPDGVYLAPALPPAPVPAAEVAHGLSRVEPRELRVEDLRVGAAVLALRVALEVDGVQVDVEHVSGGPASLWITLPQPVDFEVGVQYLNWLRLDQPRAPVLVRVEADEPRGVLFGRFRPRALPWSETLPATPSRQLERHGVQLRLDPGTQASERLSGFAAALRALFGWEARVLTLDPAQPPAPWPGIVMNFGPAEELERKFTGLISLVEHYALSTGGD